MANWDEDNWDEGYWDSGPDDEAGPVALTLIKPTNMIELKKFLNNPFDDPSISMDELIGFSIDHLARTTSNNTGGVFTTRITATTGALTTVETAYGDDKTKANLRKGQNLVKDAFRKSLPVAIEKIYGAVLTKFGSNSQGMTDCFGKGRNIYGRCKDADLAEELQSLVGGITTHQAELDASVLANAKALQDGWNAVFQPSKDSSGAKVTSRVSKTNARAALQLELFLNLLAIAQQFPRQPDQLDIYMQQSLLEPHTQSTSARPPPTRTAEQKKA